jgi:hypothetical protein
MNIYTVRSGLMEDNMTYQGEVLVEVIYFWYGSFPN